MPRTLAPRLLAPVPADPAARGAPYLAAVALQLQPGWGQFLDDCRFRLPMEHPLNAMSLAATVELAIDARGDVAILALESSGNHDFDHAVRDAIRDASPMPPPPRELTSDDDRVHLGWLFARDRRQAGPATARVVDVEQPLADVVARRISSGELGRAAQRIAHAPLDGARDDATTQVMSAALREAVVGFDTAARHEAIDAIARARVVDLAPEVRGLLAASVELELRLAAVTAVVALADRAAVKPLTAQLAIDLPEHPRLALAETQALVALGDAADVTAALRAEFVRGEHDENPPTIAVSALAFVKLPDLGGRLAAWLVHGDARTRAAVCSAAVALSAPPSWLARSLADPDASVRATCADAAAVLHARGAVHQLVALAHDRDRAVRARAIAALATLEPSRVAAAASDPSAEVRAAFASVANGSELLELLDDRDGDVRAAAWQALVTRTPPGIDRQALALQATRDPVMQVRLAAVAMVDDATLARLADADDSPDVRGAALVTLAQHRGRAAFGDVLLARLAASPAGSVDRVHAALAWLLAR